MTNHVDFYCATPGCDGTCQTFVPKPASVCTGCKKRNWTTRRPPEVDAAAAVDKARQLAVDVLPPLPKETDEITSQDKDPDNVTLRAGFLRGLALREGLSDHDRLMLRRASRSLRAFAARETSDDVDQAVRMLRTYALAAKARTYALAAKASADECAAGGTREDTLNAQHFMGRLEGLEVAIELLRGPK